MRYQWKPGARFSPKVAQVVGERLERLRRQHGGLNIDIVLGDARDRESPLHSLIEWEDSVAAEAWRRHLASSIITQIEVVVESTPHPARAFVVVREDNRTHYQSLGHAMSIDDLRAQVLSRAKNEFRAVSEKYRRLQELAKVHQAIASM
jgi:heme-degrading monooxygenase HmoA